MYRGQDGSLPAEQRWEDDDVFAVYIDVWDRWPGLEWDEIEVKYHEERAGIILKPDQGTGISSLDNVYDTVDRLLSGKREREIVWIQEDTELEQDAARYHNGVLSIYFSERTG